MIEVKQNKKILNKMKKLLNNCNYKSKNLNKNYK